MLENFTHNQDYLNKLPDKEKHLWTVDFIKRLFSNFEELLSKFLPSETSSLNIICIQCHPDLYNARNCYLMHVTCQVSAEQKQPIQQTDEVMNRYLVISIDDLQMTLELSKPLSTKPVELRSKKEIMPQQLLIIDEITLTHHIHKLFNKNGIRIISVLTNKPEFTRPNIPIQQWSPEPPHFDTRQRTAMLILSRQQIDMQRHATLVMIQQRLQQLAKVTNAPLDELYEIIIEPVKNKTYLASVLTYRYKNNMEVNDDLLQKLVNCFLTNHAELSQDDNILRPLANLLARYKKYADQITIIQKFIQHNSAYPKLATLYCAMGEAKLNLNLPQDAIDYFIEATRLPGEDEHTKKIQKRAAANLEKLRNELKEHKNYLSQDNWLQQQKRDRRNSFPSIIVDRKLAKEIKIEAESFTPPEEKREVKSNLTRRCSF